ncbi:MAG: hypothetical protein ACYSWT_07065 [Planctomycetota bacterium]|jgi:hypothetical protein
MIEQLGHQRAARRETMLQDLTAAMRRHHRRRRLRRIAAAWGLLLAVAGAAWIVRAQPATRPVWPDKDLRKVEIPVPRVVRVTGGYRTGLVAIIDDDELVTRLTEIDRPAGLIRTEGRVWLTGTVVDTEIDTGDGPEPPL